MGFKKKKNTTPGILKQILSHQDGTAVLYLYILCNGEQTYYVYFASMAIILSPAFIFEFGLSIIEYSITF